MNRGELWLDKSEFDKAFSKMDKAISESIPANPSCRYNWARHSLGGERRSGKKPLDDFNSSIGSNPNAAWPRLQRGRLLHEKGKLDEALEDFNAVIRLDPNDADGLTWRGFIREAKAETEAAIGDYLAAIRSDASSLFARQHLGEIWSSKEDFDKAIAEFSDHCSSRTMPAPSAGGPFTPFKTGC